MSGKKRIGMNRYGTPKQYAIVLITAFLLGIVMSFGFKYLSHANTSNQEFSLTSFGAQGAPVTLEVSGNLPQKDGVRMLKLGQGQQIKEGGQLLYTVSSFTYSPGRVLEDNELTKITATSANREDLGELADAVIGKRVGSRIAYLKTAVDRNSVEIVVIDLLPTRFAGEHVQPTNWAGNPIINNSPELIPQFVTRGDPPTEVKTHSLIAGQGNQIVQGDVVYANYVLIDFDGKVLDNTYADASPAVIDTKDIFAGMQQGLIDQRIGSRLLIGIPASLAHGDHDLLAVVDLLAKVEKVK